MSAEMAVRQAALAALNGDEAFMTGVNALFDGKPVRASPPYAVVGECIATDWGGKELDGREVRLTVSLHDAGDTPATLSAMLGRIDPAMRTLGEIAGGWRVGSARLLRSRLSKAGERDGWQALVDYRFRLARSE